MEEVKKYRPVYVEFDVATDGTPVPENLGTFETADEAVVFMAKKFFSTNQAILVNRFMDNFEKSEIRKKVTDILENMMPTLEANAREASEEFNEAKVRKEKAIETVNAFTNQAKALAVEVKRGLVDMNLDELFTWKLPYKGRYYYFTFIDKSIRLVRISDMTDSEKTELFSQGKINEEAFEPKIDEQIKETRKKK